MIYHYEISDLPKVSKYYLITRLTSWQSVDECNILIFILNGESSIFSTADEIKFVPSLMLMSYFFDSKSISILNLYTVSF